MINQDLVQTFNTRENNNGTTLPVSQLEQGSALAPLKFLFIENEESVQKSEILIQRLCEW